MKVSSARSRRLPSPWPSPKQGEGTLVKTLLQAKAPPLPLLGGGVGGEGARLEIHHLARPHGAVGGEGDAEAADGVGHVVGEVEVVAYRLQQVALLAFAQGVV